MTKNITDRQIRLLAEEAFASILAGDSEEVLQKLKPILNIKCPFPKLDLLGKEIGQAGRSHPQKFFKTFDEIIDYDAMGGFVIVGRALVQFLESDFNKVMEKSREYIIKGDKWYVSDIAGERSLGQALVDYFDQTLPWLKKFLKDENKWVRRSAGVAVHFFSKRVLDEPEKTKKLLKLMEPHVEEKQKDAVKGIGWGLKTIGKHHSDILVDFLKKQLGTKRKLSKVIMRKALTYLGEGKKRTLTKLYKKEYL